MTTKKKVKKAKSVKKVKSVKSVMVEVKKPTVEPLQAYRIEMRTHERRAALQHDAQAWGMIKILKQLSALRDASVWEPRAREIMTRDLEYLEKLYKR